MIPMIGPDVARRIALAALGFSNTCPTGEVTGQHSGRLPGIAVPLGFLPVDARFGVVRVAGMRTASGKVVVAEGFSR
jgi:hypothetical protein